MRGKQVDRRDLGNSRARRTSTRSSTKYNQLTTYYSTGNPSEPNYTALGGGDDFGIIDDNWFGCGASRRQRAEGRRLRRRHRLRRPAAAGDRRAAAAATARHLRRLQRHAGTACGTAPTGGTNHNVPGDNLFTLMSKAGLTIRTYSESMNPGQDVRSDSIADAAVADTYNADRPGRRHRRSTSAPPTTRWSAACTRSSTARRSPTRRRATCPSSRRQPHHLRHAVHARPTGRKSTAYPVPSGWIYDQFSTDLAAGDVGNINFIMPDQCDDMHGVGTDASCVSNNNGQAIGIKRADIYLGKVVTEDPGLGAVEEPAASASPSSSCSTKAKAAARSCCGWNAGGTNSGAAPVTRGRQRQGARRRRSRAATRAGNFGHGNSIFGIITNQQDVGTAKKNVADSDAYSHFSFLRTLQDMFQVADPAVDATLPEPGQVHRGVHHGEHRVPAGIRRQRGHALRLGAPDQPRLRDPGELHAEALRERHRRPGRHA